MKIYFEDSSLVTSGYLPFAYHYAIDAKYGISANIAQLDTLRECEPNATVYTNSIIALNNEYAWNKELKVPEIYIRAGEHMIFTRIDKLTTRELREGHNIAKMWISGEFEKGISEHDVSP